MAYQIVAIRTEGFGATTTDKITAVKLSDGITETVSQVVTYIDAKMEYYYTTSTGSRADVESVHPVQGNAYIRTVRNGTTQDNLLNLPEF
ncbi:DUF3892 domain-containing protein [Lacticaseibacillus absianus]|uniref:DUF3892 domain-containing protein n=1 Tax=Lacticaseibacillus absianus TaxID=2729623 RepID=UPI0015C76220|nr:DUF3892 domain-containing protein [Lacticaseibacillus absianus]